MNTDKMREQFEAWAIADGYRNFSKSDDGSYIGNVDYSWKAWQAAHESQSTELAQARAKHYEECAVICDQQFSKSETLIERYINRGINICKTVIRAAAKQ